MDYREYAKDLLSRKKELTSAYTSLKIELESLEHELHLCKTVSLNSPEEERERHTERIVNILTAIDDCRFRRGVVERELTKIEKGMGGLTDYQRELIECFFVDYSLGTVEDLMERWYKERSTVYRDRNRALEAFTRSIYGVLQL